jgi:hypothetical protein
MGWQEAGQKAGEFYEKAKAFDKAAKVIDKAVAAVPLIGAGVALIKCVFSEDGITIENVMDEIQSLRGELIHALNELKSELEKLARVTHEQTLHLSFQNEWGAITEAYAKARSWVDSVEEDPPGDHTIWDDFVKSLPDMGQKMRALFPHEPGDSPLDNVYFQRIYVEELLYHYRIPRAGFEFPEGKLLAPDRIPDDGIGVIWDYGWMLPALLHAIPMRLAVLSLYYPKYYAAGFAGYTDLRNEIQAYAAQLWEIHNEIRANIKVIPRPALRKWLCRTDTAYIWSVPETVWIVSDKTEMTYGAVECYSATASVDTYTLTNPPPAPALHPPRDPDEFWQEWNAYWANCQAW